MVELVSSSNAESLEEQEHKEKSSEVPLRTTRGFLLQTAALRVEDDEEIVQQRVSEETQKEEEGEEARETAEKNDENSNKNPNSSHNDNSKPVTVTGGVAHQSEKSDSKLEESIPQPEEVTEDIYNSESYQRYIQEVRDTIEADEDEGYSLLQVCA